MRMNFDWDGDGHQGGFDTAMDWTIINDSLKNASGNDPNNKNDDSGCGCLAVLGGIVLIFLFILLIKSC